MKTALLYSISVLLVVLLAKAVTPVPTPNNFTVIKLCSDDGQWGTLYWRNNHKAGYQKNAYLHTTWKPIVTEVSPRRWTIVFSQLNP